MLNVIMLPVVMLNVVAPNGVFGIRYLISQAVTPATWLNLLGLPISFLKIIKGGSFLPESLMSSFNLFLGDFFISKQMQIF
jgi:hypothetical protein